jgi:hypothetical protein
VNLRPVLTICCLATLGLLQAGCASNPTTGSADMQPGSLEVGDRPQMAFPGATRAEVKALAMGSARSRAWIIVESTDDRLVAQRPLDPSSPSARALGPSATAPGSLVEVTSYFLEDRGGVKVALDAVVVSPAPAPNPPTRIDATETFRPSLDESLRSLQATWSRDRARIARAAPPVGGIPGEERATAGTDTTLTDASERSLPVPTDPAAARMSEPSSPPTSVRTPTTAARTAWSTPQPTPQSTPARQSTPIPASVAAAPTAPTPEARRPAAGPAPVVDASPTLTRTTPGATTQPMSLPDPLAQPAAEPLPADENMMALSPSSGSVSWAYYAEQYARLRGCNVGPQGSILIDSRSDGEIHKVPCDGADSVLVQCQNGECRGLL